jgi:hypothetical protein
VHFAALVLAMDGHIRVVKRHSVLERLEDEFFRFPDGIAVSRHSLFLCHGVTSFELNVATWIFRPRMRAASKSGSIDEELDGP